MFTRVTVAFVSCCRANYSEWNMTPHPLSALAFDHWAVLCSVQKREGGMDLERILERILVRLEFGV